MILLDTHILLWLAENDPRIGSEVRATLNEAAYHRELFLSPISVWEIALKHSRGRLQLAPITSDIACECVELPAAFHGDPADRLIVATARIDGMLLVTADDKLLTLAERGYFQAIAV